MRSSERVIRATNLDPRKFRKDLMDTNTTMPDIMEETIEIQQAQDLEMPDQAQYRRKLDRLQRSCGRITRIRPVAP